MAYADLAAPAGAEAAPTVLRRNAIVLATLLLVAIVTRGLWIGDPLVGGDEQFYLLVGDRLWQGTLPYVDIWDRKPIGLFLIYAALRPFSSDGIAAYQIGALVFATMTAFVIARIASRLVPLHIATIAGCLYLVWLPVLGGVGGQSPVFYNLFMANAALVLVKAGEAADDRGARRLAGIAMLLVGLAMQVKYTAIVEGIAFGLWLMHRMWAEGRGLVDLLRHATLLIAAALLPTFLAASFYIIEGHAGPFFYTNFFSIFLKHTPASETANIAHNAVLFGPLLLGAIHAFGVTLRRRRLIPLEAFLAIWSVASICGFFVVGHYYTHYALPMLVPLCIACALGPRRRAALLTLSAIGVALYVGTTGFPSTERMLADHRKIDRMVQILTPYTRYGCIYLNEGPPILYLLTQSCLPTPYVFPEHLTLAAEAPAFDTVQAMTRLLDRKPPAVVVRHWTEPGLRNVGTDHLLASALVRDYRFKARIEAPKPRDVLDIFTRNDLP